MRCSRLCDLLVVNVTAASQYEDNSFEIDMGPICHGNSAHTTRPTPNAGIIVFVESAYLEPHDRTEAYIIHIS